MQSMTESDPTNPTNFLLLVLACFTDQSVDDHFDVLSVQVADTYEGITATVGMTAARMSLAAAVLPADGPSPETNKASQLEKESALD